MDGFHWQSFLIGWMLAMLVVTLVMKAGDL